MPRRRYADVSERLDIHDERHGNVDRVLQRTRNPLELMYSGVQAHMRLASHYVEVHSILEHISKGILKGKHVLHVGSCNGAYAQFLQSECKAKVVALDLDPMHTKDSRKRGVRTVRANAIPKKEEGGFEQKASGLWVPKEPRLVTHLPFKDKSFEFVISEHFLFSNFHKGIKNDPGFEKHEGSLERSEDALFELNRVLKKNGRVLVAHTHRSEVSDLQKYIKGFKIAGFELEVAYDRGLNEIHPIPPYAFTSPYNFVLKKVKDIK